MSTGRKASRQGSRAGLGTSTGRPMTGRPMTGRPMTGRPMTSSAARPGTSAGGAMYEQGVGGVEEDEVEYDDGDYESEDDGDVFAFVPPDLGPAPQVVLTSEVTSPNASASAAAASAAAGNENAEEEETFYYDEATGAVYDAQGRLVQMPSGFDASAVHQQQQDESVAVDHPLNSGVAEPERLHTSEILPAHQVPRQPVAAAVGAAQSHIDELQMSSYRSKSFEDPTAAESISKTSLDRKDSNSSSVSRDPNAPILKHARSISGFPSMDVLPEVDSGLPPKTPTRPISRDVGLTVTNAPQLDQARRGSGQSSSGLLPSHNTMRQRTNRLSQYADAGQSPVTEMKFNLEAPSYDDVDDLDGKYPPGMQSVRGDVQMQPSFSFQGAQGPSKGLRVVELEMETEEDSPYPEVRASVSNMDEPDLHVSTFRAWFLCFVLSTVAGAANTLLNFRYPAPTLTPLAVQLVAYPCGKFMAAVLPIRTWTLPRWLGGYRFSLNPGAFNIKEHALISIVLNISIGAAFGINMLIVLRSTEFYNSPRPVGFALLFIISSQILGFSLSGFCRRFLVLPASMIWPQNLVTATILNTLHAEDDGADGTMTRFRYFSIVMGCAFIWYFVPGFLFQALSSFGWICWIWPNNFVVNTVFGTQTGLGLSVLTFDWTAITYIGSPLVYPWWSECNLFAGFVIMVVLFMPALYFSNSLYTAYLPFNSSYSYDRFGQVYDIARILSNRTQLNVAQYEQYSPLFLTASYVMVYTTGFALTSAVLVHTVLYHGKSLWTGFRYQRVEEDDIHAKLMKRYPEVPGWWYALVGVVSLVVAIIAIEVYDTGMPIWAMILSIIIPAVYVLPSGFVYAMTGQIIGINLIAELIAGYVLPGNPVANQLFKVFSLATLDSGLNFTQDLKLGHYMKVPPRSAYKAQLIFTLWLSIVQVGVIEFMFGNIPDLCHPDQKHRFTCPHARVFFTSSIVWGVVGPKRLFSEEGLFAPLYYALLIGAFLPIPFWLLSRRYPRSWIKFISVPIVLNGVGYIPPASGLVYTSWFATGFVFQYMVRKYNFRWWSKYNFITSAGLDSGTVFSTLVIFVALQLPKNGNLSVNWWGNDVIGGTLDAKGLPYLQAPAQGFALSPGEAKAMGV